MKKLFCATLLAAATGLASAVLAQTATTPPHRPAPAVKPTKATVHVAARPVAVHHPVFVPPPPVIELDEMAVVPDLPTVLDTDNRDRYRRIFQDQAADRWAQADAEIAQLTDKTLMGYVGAQRLLARGYTATYEQLAAWLQAYNDHPDAPAIYRLALARQPRGAADLTPATFVSQVPVSPAFAAARTVTGADAGQAAELRTRLQQMADDGGYNAAFALLDRKSTVDLLGPQEVELWRGRMRTHALEADSQRSVQPSVEISLPPDANWSAGLAAFTSGNYAEAARRFERVADAPPDQASSWTLSAGAFWAARANLLAGNPQKFAPYLKRAAVLNRTFYGLIAQKALGMKILADFNLPALDKGETALLRNDRGRPSRAGATAAWRGDRSRARTLFGLARCRSELCRGDPGAGQQGGTARPLGEDRERARGDNRHKIPGYDAAAYPVPPWQPASGFTVDRALLYGFMRQESAFNPKARSYVGAMGLLQLMPQTARIVSSKYAPEAAGGNPYDPPVNMALGQAYIATLMGEVDGNLVRTTAGYNGGPGNVMRWDNSLNASSDPLLYVASIPLNETRDFVQRVLANYWMYEIRLGQPTPSLDQLAAHEWPRYTAQDTGSGAGR